MSLAAVGRLSAWEVAQWRYFEQEFGPLTVQERLDATAAQIAHAIHVAHGGKGQLDDFTPHWRAVPKVEITDWLSAMAKR